MSLQHKHNAMLGSREDCASGPGVRALMPSAKPACADKTLARRAAPGTAAGPAQLQPNPMHPGTPRVQRSCAGWRNDRGNPHREKARRDPAPGVVGQPKPRRWPQSLHRGAQRADPARHRPLQSARQRARPRGGPPHAEDRQARVIAPGQHTARPAQSARRARNCRLALAPHELANRYCSRNPGCARSLHGAPQRPPLRRARRSEVLRRS